MSRCTYRCLTPDGAQCELATDHEGPHRNGLLIWHDPPMLYVDGKPYVAPTNEWTFSQDFLEQIALCTNDERCQAAADEHDPGCPVEAQLLEELGF